MSLLEVRGLTRRFGGLLALSHASLEVPVASITGLIGPNGAGKTTLFNCVGGFLIADEGTVSFEGEDISRLPSHERAARGIGRTFQRLELFGNLSVAECVQVAVEMTDGGRAWPGIFALWERWEPDVHAATDELIGLLELEDVRDEPAGSLSTGRGRMVELARALATRPRLLLLDEPSAGLDERETDQLAEVLRMLVQARGIGILLVEHDMNLVMRVCDEIFVLDFGVVIARGTPAEIRVNPAVRAAYLGEEEQARTRGGRGATAARG